MISSEPNSFTKDSEKQAIKQAFSKANLTYDHFSDVQKQTGIELIDWLNADAKCDQSVLDLGCGTGETTRFLAQKPFIQFLKGMDFSEAVLMVAREKKDLQNTTFVQFDFDQPWQEPYMYDVVFANMAVQWSGNMTYLFSQIETHLKPGGQLILSLPLTGTFKEIKPFCHVNELPDIAFMQHCLKQAGFAYIKSTASEKIKWFDSIRDCLHSIKLTGACAHTSATCQDSSTSPSFAKLKHQLKKGFGQNHALTYHIGYFKAFKSI